MLLPKNSPPEAITIFRLSGQTQRPRARIANRVTADGEFSNPLLVPLELLSHAFQSKPSHSGRRRAAARLGEQGESGPAAQRFLQPQVVTQRGIITKLRPLHEYTNLQRSSTFSFRRSNFQMGYL